jgi:hemolysin III
MIQFNKREEITNALTHGVGAALALPALVVLIVFSTIYGNAWHIVSFTIFGVTLVILYLMSTLYHSFQKPSVKGIFKKFDHMAIFLLIAGTYTPFCFAALNGWVGWTIFGIVWTCAITGIVLKSIYIGKAALLSTILYVLIGWIIVFAIKPLYEAMSPSGFTLLLAGGFFYTAGTFFYMKENIPYSHSLWHVFVLLGSTFHFFSIMTLLA